VLIEPVDDDKYVGVYLAYCHQHVVEDDGRSLGKIRVVCPPLWGTAVSPECLPGASIGGGGYTAPDETTNPCGLFSVPPVGASVVIAFFGGDIDHPVYLGGFWGAPGGNFEVPFSPKQTVAKGSPDAVIWETAEWRILIENGAAPLLRLERKGNEDTAIEIDGATEDVVLRSKPSGGQEAVITIDGSSGTITVKSDTKVDLDAPAMNLGPAAVDAIIKGTAFKTFFDLHTHSGVTAGAGVTGPPSAPMDVPPGTHLSQKANTE
jgi:hypothetical protein